MRTIKSYLAARLAASAIIQLIIYIFLFGCLMYLFGGWPLTVLMLAILVAAWFGPNPYLTQPSPRKRRTGSGTSKDRRRRTG